MDKGGLGPPFFKRYGAWLALIPLVVLLLTLSVHEYDRGGILTTDTLQLLDGVAAADACLHAGELRCHGRVDRFPPLQYLPALALKRIGRSRVGTGNDLVYLNGLAVLATLALLWLAGQRMRPGLGGVLLLTGLVSPLLWYATTGFGEALAVLATTGLVVAVLLGWHPVAGAAFMWAAAISKETALPALLVLAALALVVRVDTKRPPRRAFMPVLLGAAAGLATLAAVNLFRFGVPWNSVYLGNDFGVHGVGWKADFAVGSLVAPNAGVLWFWPVASVLLGGIAAMSIRSLRRDGFARAPAVGVAAGAVMLLLFVSFAAWWAPYGWQAFGNRLIVPWVPGLVVIAVAAMRDPLARALRRLAASRGRLAVAGLVAVVLGLPQIAVFLEPVTPLSLFSSAPSCPYVPNLLDRIAAGDASAHEAESRCVSLLAWHHSPVLADAYDQLRRSYLLVAALYVLAVAGVLASTARMLCTDGWPYGRSAVKLPPGL